MIERKKKSQDYKYIADSVRDLRIFDKHALQQSII